MAEDLIRYDILVQEALRGIVRKVLHEVARTGLPGDHHFYISFETSAPGVRVSNRIRSKYPKDMTIVLQHQFWDLVVTETTFEIGLSFGGVPEHLHIPFKAVKGFFDPHVQFNLQFEPYRPDEAEGDGADAATEGETVPLMRAVEENETAADDMEATVRALAESGNDDAAETAAEPEKAEDEAAEASGETGKDDGDKDGDDGEEKPAGADVVSLDAFRKKS
ncbi:hypothetical protein GGD81_004457 [Rhodobium orientis]|uniref:Stringent starvation protein B n=1 Tax=Rhodobium orientis TaxID=34017 RepID=A0A327JFS8_9HYPH|nr:ClpXP protease specificity-enhancing factor SspB [Rhodobium orientis]MBB4305381.1 hypothetical protein [Rhodobium orientis]MBK5950085.1 hypothetical protein [Rhodobium orientis]RAI25247.1 hypothetical protein CH339_19060 [Rhodobium orientis]